MTSKLFFKTFTNCILVKGYNRCIIIDIQRGIFTTIPDTMLEVVEKLNSKESLVDIVNYYGIENKETIDEYITFLIENDFGFFTDFEDFDLFIEMDKSFELPSYITNCIIEISECNISNISKLITGLENLLCRDVQFLCYDKVEIDSLKKILNVTKSIDLRSIEFILLYTEDVIKFIPEIDKNNFRVTEITLFNSKNTNQIIEETTFNIRLLESNIKNFKHCGIVNNKYFHVNKEKVLESLNHNSCLNQKISIDTKGDIKNCPSMEESFGNIENTTLEQAVNHPDFKKYWNITKDQIDVCKDCEFRHVCTDCRAYIEEPKNRYSKPLKCGYSPYTNKWEEWSTNPLKQKAIEFYGIQDLVKKDV